MQMSGKDLRYFDDQEPNEEARRYLPHVIYKAIEALQLNPDYEFREVPMSYDITINAKKAGTKEVEYQLLPARKESPLTDDEEADLDAQKPIAELQKLLEDKEQGKSDGFPKNELNSDGPPF